MLGNESIIQDRYIYRYRNRQLVLDSDVRCTGVFNGSAKKDSAYRNRINIDYISKNDGVSRKGNSER